MRKVLTLLLLFHLFRVESFSQSNLGFRWVQSANLPNGSIWGFHLTEAGKSGGKICFVDHVALDPLEVKENGMVLPYPEYPNEIPWTWCGNSGTRYATGLNFTPTNLVIRNLFFEDSFGPGLPSSTIGFVTSSANTFSYSHMVDRIFTPQYLVSGQKQYYFGYGVEVKADCSLWQSCNQFLNTLWMECHAPNMTSKKRVFQQPYPFALSNTKMSLSREGLPMLSFQTQDSVDWKGLRWSTNGPAYVQLILNDSLDIVRQRQFTLQPDSNFHFQLYRGNEGQDFLVGNREIGGVQRAEIQRLDSLGHLIWAYQSPEPDSLMSAFPDPQGNHLLLLKNNENQQQSMVVLSHEGAELWRYKDSSQTFDQIIWQSIKGVDELQWAFIFLKNFNSTASQLQFGPINLPVSEGDYIGLIGRPTISQPALSLDIQSDGCKNNNNRIVIENQGINFGPDNQFLVELSDSSGQFGTQPLVLSDGPSFIKNFTVPAQVPPGLHYKIRIRATQPDTIGATYAFPIRAVPEKPFLAISNNQIQVCASHPVVKVLNPAPGVQYYWPGRNFWGDSLTVINSEYVQVRANLGQCSSLSDFANAQVVSPVVNLVSSNNICAYAGPVSLQTNRSGGYWLGPQTDSSGLFTPQHQLDTLELVYHVQIGDCKVIQPFTIYQHINPEIAPIQDTMFCGNIQWQLPMQGLPQEYWFGPNIFNSAFSNQGQLGPFQIYHRAGIEGCISLDTVIITGRNQFHPYCKAGLDSLSNLQTLMELGPNLCQTSVPYKIWAHWEHYNDDNERPYRLEFSTLATDFSNPVVQSQQIIPYFSGTLNLPPGKYFYRVTKLNPMEAGPVDSLRLFSAPAKPIIIKSGISSYCPGAPINQTRYYVQKTPGITHIWSPGNVSGDTLIPNTTGSFTVRAFSEACTSAISNPQTIVYKSLGTLSMTSPSKVCLPAAPFQLTANVQSPTWIGPQVDSTTGIFYPGPGEGNTVVMAKKMLSGCLVTKLFDIAQWNKPAVGPNYSFQTCTGFGPVSLTGQPSGGIWSGNGISGGNSFFSPNPGVFPLVYTTQNSQCKAADTILVTVLEGYPANCFTQVREAGSEGSFSISPNPGKQDFLFSLPQSTGPCQFEFYNSLGQVIFNCPLANTGKSFHLRLPQLFPPGVYLARIEAEGKRFVARLVIE